MQKRFLRGDHIVHKRHRVVVNKPTLTAMVVGYPHQAVGYVVDWEQRWSREARRKQLPSLHGMKRHTGQQQCDMAVQQLSVHGLMSEVSLLLHSKTYAATSTGHQWLQTQELG